MTRPVPNDAELPEGSVLLGTVVVEMFLPHDGDNPICRTRMFDAQGETLPLISTLGMIEIARQTAWDMSLGNYEEDENGE